MEEYNVLILMEKDCATGFMNSTIGSYTIHTGMGFIDKIYAVESGDNFTVNLFLTTQDVEDWQFSAIFDYYDTDVFIDEQITEIQEIDDNYNPIWLLKFNYCEDTEIMESKINKIVAIHVNELAKTMEEISKHKEEYN